MATKKHLGRGLSALLGDDSAPTAAQTDAKGEGGARSVPVEFLHPGRYQPRSTFDPALLDELAQSVRANGVIQPILVRPHPDRRGEFEIVAGERRWRAAQMARLHEVPIVVRALNNREALELALIENIQRQDLNPLEEAEGYRRLMAEFSYTQEELAERVGKSRPAVANALRLLDLPGQIRSWLAEGKLSPGHARALLKVTDPLALAREVIERGLSVRQTEALSKNFKPGGKGDAGKKGAAKNAALAKDADTRALERDLAQSLGLKVAIDFDGKGGRVTLHYKTLEQLDEIAARLGRAR